ncbi:MAG: hypothetical protein K2I81_03425 [Alphaproteobacteria bacterium]|nr:hypothetical protein [Alphaproteobacteria bacterium]
MKIKIFYVMLVLSLSGGNAMAKCASAPLDASGKCTGVWCVDGCWVCCNPQDESLALCSGAYTTNTTSSFSDSIGSGYVELHVYGKNCRCPLSIL